MVEFLYYNINPPHGNSLAAFSVDFKDFALPFSWSFPPVIVPRVIVDRFRADTGVCPYAVKFPDVGVLPRL